MRRFILSILICLPTMLWGQNEPKYLEHLPFKDGKINFSTEIKVPASISEEKMYETLLTNEECAKAIDLGNFYRVPADNRTLNYDKFFTEGDEKRVTLTEFNSDNTTRLTVEETKAKIAALEYIQNELNGIANIGK